MQGGLYPWGAEEALLKGTSHAEALIYLIILSDVCGKMPLVCFYQIHNHKVTLLTISEAWTYGLLQDLEYFSTALSGVRIAAPQSVSMKSRDKKCKQTNFPPKRAATMTAWRSWSWEPCVSQPPSWKHEIPGLENGILLRVGKKSCSWDSSLQMSSVFIYPNLCTVFV